MRSVCGSVLLSVALLGCAEEAVWPPTHWPGEDLAPCEALERSAYRIDEIRVATTSDDAARLGWDLDHDGTLDNHGGNLLAAVANVVTTDLSAESNDTLDADLVHVVITVDRCVDQGYALVELHRGSEIDRNTDPPRLRVEAVTSYAMVAPALPGPAEFGVTQFPVGALLHTSETGWLDAPRFVTVVDTIGELELRGRLVGAFDGEPMFDVVTRASAAIITDLLAAHPECPAACEDEDLVTMMGILDTDEDWQVTPEELRANGLVSTLLRPDVEGDGPVWDSTLDDVDALLSLGVGFSASPVDLVE